MKKNFFYTITIFMVLGSMNLFAQSPIDSIPNKDSIPPAQVTQDTLNNAPQVTDSNIVSAQPEPAKPAKVKKDTRPLSQRIRFSFASAFWVNSSSLYFELSPMVTYYFPKTFSIGAGPTYVLNEERATNSSYNGWGGKIYGRADITRWLYSWVEYQGIDNAYDANTDLLKYEKSHEYVSSLFLSLGINLRLGRRSFNAQALYDVLYHSNSSHYTPSEWTYRVSFGF